MEAEKECKVVELRSGKELSNPYKVLESESKEEKGSQIIEEEEKDGSVVVQKSVSQPTSAKYAPKIPYLPRL